MTVGGRTASRWGPLRCEGELLEFPLTSLIAAVGGGAGAGAGKETTFVGTVGAGEAADVALEDRGSDTFVPSTCEPQEKGRIP